MTVVAGIDEAGYGPLLGPLVVAAAAYRLDDGVKESTLNRVVHDKTLHAQGLPTADSKRLYHAGGTIRRIETSTLGHVVLGRGVLPVRVSSLLAGAVDVVPAEIESVPWYRGRLLDTHLPRAADIEDVLERADHHESWLAERELLRKP